MEKRTELLIERNKARVESVGDYILNRFQKDPLTGCWNWTGSIGTDGYGKAKKNGKTIRAHRLSYTHFKGEIKEGMFICHTCDNTRCVYPGHLWQGTHYENELDKTNKGRRSPSPSISHKHLIPRGERVNTAKLTKDLVLKIHELSSLGFDCTKIKNSLNLSVHRSTILQIVNGKSWAHLHPSNIK